MKTYSARAVRWAGGWEVHIDDVGVTQCRTLDQAERQAADYIATMFDLDDTSDIEVTVTPDLGDLGEEVEGARGATFVASAMQKDAAARTRIVARRLREERGLSVSDTATILHVSRGRVSQLLKAPAEIEYVDEGVD